MSGGDLICAPCVPILHVHQICPLVENRSHSPVLYCCAPLPLVHFFFFSPLEALLSRSISSLLWRLSGNPSRRAPWASPPEDAGAEGESQSRDPATTWLSRPVVAAISHHIDPLVAFPSARSVDPLELRWRPEQGSLGVEGGGKGRVWQRLRPAHGSQPLAGSTQSLAASSYSQTLPPLSGGSSSNSVSILGVYNQPIDFVCAYTNTLHIVPLYTWIPSYMYNPVCVCIRYEFCLNLQGHWWIF
jgi:hypothetical protein